MPGAILVLGLEEGAFHQSGGASSAARLVVRSRPVHRKVLTSSDHGGQACMRVVGENGHRPLRAGPVWPYGQLPLPDNVKMFTR